MKPQTLITALALTTLGMAAPSQLSHPAKRGGIGDMLGLGGLLGGGTKSQPPPPPQSAPQQQPNTYTPPAPSYGNDFAAELAALQKAIDAFEAAEATQVSTLNAELASLKAKDHELTEADKLLLQSITGLKDADKVLTSTDIGLKETDKVLKATDEGLKVKIEDVDRRLCALEKWLGEHYAYNY